MDPGTPAVAFFADPAADVVDPAADVVVSVDPFVVGVAVALVADAFAVLSAFVVVPVADVFADPFAAAAVAHLFVAGAFAALFADHAVAFPVAPGSSGQTHFPFAAAAVVAAFRENYHACHCSSHPAGPVSSCRIR